MSQPSLFASITWTVTRLTQHIRSLLETDPTLQDLWVQGEISNLARPASGHVYFTLKDAGASLRCVMWRMDARRLNLSLQDGMAVEAHGKLGVYEPQGQYQFYADLVRPVGEGALYQEFLRLKALLEAEGLFDAERKRPIPELPRKIGVVTSATGAALRDMLNTLRRRLPLAEVILAASPVQGDEAPPGLVSSLAALERLSPDVILLARGGGSIEDLWAFNDERVVRAVAACKVPLISGVGHETDFTLADFAADLRAPTPTAAAELATPVTLADLSSWLQETKGRLAASTLGLLAARKGGLASLAARLRFASPQRRIQTSRQRLDDLSRRRLSAAQHRLSLEGARAKGLERRLQSLSPLAVLARGYAVVTRGQDGALVSSVGRVQTDDEIFVRVTDGQFGAVVRKSQIVNRRS
ncbi:MAG: exodeoxyribonuclease VII large subunit [Chloroflexota bacterium]